jgi:hypothetical protein
MAAGVSRTPARFAARTIGEPESSDADVRAPGPKEVGSVSVIPIPEPTEVAPTGIESAAPRLHLVPEHEHTWRLLAVEYDEGLEIRRYECESCDDVQFS